MSRPPRATKIFFGPRGPEVKFGQIAPSLGNQKLRVLGCFLHRFGSILASLRADYGQIMQIIKNPPTCSACARGLPFFAFTSAFSPRFRSRFFAVPFHFHLFRVSLSLSLALRFRVVS